MFGLESDLLVLMVLCLVCALAFEFINGFHDTANAVATVIYTNSLKPVPAVIWSGLMNGIGVLTGGVGVAYGIVKLLPLDTILSQSAGMNVALILSLLLAAIIWNLGTWYFGIPASSSHTLIGSLLGVGLAMSLDSPDGFGAGVNWHKAQEIGLALLLSPLFGFMATILLMLILRYVTQRKKKPHKKATGLFDEPDRTKNPPFFIRLVLILTCTGVSYAHGNNDGQKGVGLVMIILFAFAPAYFLLNQNKRPDQLQVELNRTQAFVASLDTASYSLSQKAYVAEVQIEMEALTQAVAVSGNETFQADIRKDVRTHLVNLNKSLANLVKSPEALSQEQKQEAKAIARYTKSFYEYAPWWVILSISLALGIGTMIGWKRIVKTIGEKIGKQHLSYAQGMSAEMVAATTIYLASDLKLPVSTTHVLSSGIAGSMVASGGIKNLQGKTIKNIAMAWVLTLPVTIGLSFGLYLLFKLVFQ